MSDKRPPYDRRQTKPIPRVELAPPSRRTVDDAEDVALLGVSPEERAAMLRAERAEEPTQMECPWCCGHGMVSPEKRAEWLAAHPELAETRVIAPNEK